MAGTILLIGIGRSERERLAATLSAIGCSVTLHHASDGALVERYLAEQPAPALVLLAEEMAGATSLPVLEALRTHLDLDHVAVVIVGDAAHAADHDRGYARLGSAVLEPSGDTDAYRDAVVRLAERFLTDWLPAAPSTSSRDDA